MAIQLARAYTGNYDVIIFEESFHGGLSTGADMSAKVKYIFGLSPLFFFALTPIVFASSFIFIE